MICDDRFLAVYGIGNEKPYVAEGKQIYTAAVSVDSFPFIFLYKKILI